MATILSGVVKLRNRSSAKRLRNPGRNKERRAATLLTCIGSDALDVIDAVEFENEDQRPRSDLRKDETILHWGVQLDL